MWRIIALVALGAALVGAVPGVPEPPRPGPFPDIVVDVGNDALGGEIGDNADDFRTNELSLQALFDRRWLLVVDHSMLTKKSRVDEPAERSDELTATLDVLVEPFVAPDRSNRVWLVAGGGARVAGRLGGQEAQDALHRALGYHRVDLPYGSSSTVGVLDAGAGWLWLESVPVPTLPFLARGQVGLQVQAKGVATSGDERQAEAGADLVLVGRDGATWVGPRYRVDDGEAATAAARAVATREAGWWLDYGASAGGWFVAASVNLRDRETLGTVGWIGGRRSARLADARPAEVEADLELTGGFTPGVQARWQPRGWASGGWLAQRSAILVDYRYGSVDAVDWGRDVVLTFNQAIVGAEVAWSRPRPGWQCSPFIRAGVGERSEFTRVRGPSPRFDVSATRAVAVAGAGARLTWGPALRAGRTARYGIAAFVDGWLPAGDALARSGADAARYQRPGAAPGVALTTVVAW